MQDMTSSCRHPVLNSFDTTQQARVGDQYAARHNPFVYFHSLLDGGACAANDIDLSQLQTDLSEPYGWDVADELYDNAQVTGWHTGYPDLQARIDLSTARMIPWEPATAAFLLGLAALRLDLRLLLYVELPVAHRDLARLSV